MDHLRENCVKKCNFTFIRHSCFLASDLEIKSTNYWYTNYRIIDIIDEISKNRSVTNNYTNSFVGQAIKIFNEDFVR